MPKYKLLTDVLLNDGVHKRGGLVEMDAESAAPYLERGTFGNEDAQIDERTTFERAKDEAAETAEANQSLEQPTTTPEAPVEDAPLDPTPPQPAVVQAPAVTGQQPTQEQIDAALTAAGDGSTTQPTS